MTATKSNTLLLFLLCAAFAAGALFFLRNGSHADALHPEAPALRAQICQDCRPGGDRDGDGRSKIEFYYSGRLGTLLILARLDGTQAGGLVLKITELRGGRQAALLDKSYERTCFVADELYWTRVILRDNYVLLPTALIGGALTAGLASLLAALAYVVRRLRGDGYGDLADRLQEEMGGG